MTPLLIAWGVWIFALLLVLVLCFAAQLGDQLDPVRSHEAGGHALDFLDRGETVADLLDAIVA